MKMRVEIDPACIFDIGSRSPESRELIRLCIKAFMQDVAAHAGFVEGVQSVEDEGVPAYVWKDERWTVGYTVEMSGLLFWRRARIRIREIQLH